MKERLFISCVLLLSLVELSATGLACGAGQCDFGGTCYNNGLSAALPTACGYGGCSNENWVCSSGTWKYANGRSCPDSSKCYSGNCVSGYCCNGGQCGFTGGCYNDAWAGVLPTSCGYGGCNNEAWVCRGGTWRKGAGRACVSAGECDSNNCVGGFCCAGGTCGFGGACYADGWSGGLPTSCGYGGCFNEAWVCRGGILKKGAGRSCANAGECDSNNCVGGYCCSSGTCGWGGNCYANMWSGQLPTACGYGGCFNENWYCCAGDLKRAYSGDAGIDCMRCTHLWSMSSAAPAYTVSFNPSGYLIDDGYYVVCPGSTMSVTGSGSYNLLCSNGWVTGTQTNFVSWTYSNTNSKLALRYTARGIDSTYERPSVIGPASGKGGISITSSSPTNDIYTFNGASTYKVYLDSINAYCDSPNYVVCPYLGGTWRTNYCQWGYINTVAEAEGWLILNQYNVLIPNPSISITKPGDLYNVTSSTLSWTITNNGVGKVTVSMATACIGWSCDFTGYTQGRQVTIAQGGSYTVVLDAAEVASGDPGNQIGITITYDDGYGLSCISPASIDSRVNIYPWPPPVTTVVPTTVPSVVPPVVPPVSPEDDARYVTQVIPKTTVLPGEVQSVSITMENNGSTNWTDAEGYRLGSQNPQDNTIWGLGRAYLSPGEIITPWSTKTYVFDIKAPQAPGSYNFQWRTLREGVHWFGDYTPNVVITVICPYIDVNISCPPDIFDPNKETFLLTWNLTNNGSYNAAVSVKRSCDGWPCNFTTYNEGDIIHLAAGSIYPISLNVTIPNLNSFEKHIGINVTYDDDYDAMCNPPKTENSSVKVIIVHMQ